MAVLVSSAPTAVQAAPMAPKLLLLFLGIIAIQKASGGKLLKVPRIYNALITSDEELLPSQAYPAVAPVLRPSGPVYLTPAGGYEGAKPQPALQPALPPALPQINEQPLPTAKQLDVWLPLKNNRPPNPEIPDVPPPPLPVTFKQKS